MKILFLTPTSIFSGGERITLGIAVTMRDRGHEISYCGLEGPVRTVIEDVGIPFIALSHFTPWSVRAIVRSVHPDIVHAMDFRASFYAALSGKPFVAHLHNNSPWLGRYGFNSLATLFFGCRAEKVIVVSRSVLDEYVFAKAIRGNTVVLGNTVRLRVVREASRAAPCNGTYDIGFIGRFVEQKRPCTFIEIVARLRERLPQIRALMIGDGELRPAVEKSIAAYGLQDNVTLSGFLENPFPAISGCGLMLMPSAWEGFGLTAVESMALGKPVLASPVGGLHDIVDESCGKLCASVDTFVEEAHALLTGAERYGQKSRAALARAAEYDENAGYYDHIEAVYTSRVRV